MKNITYRIIIEPDEKGTYHAYVPALRGCHTWGESIEEAKKNIRDAMSLYIESMLDMGEKLPEELGFESFETISILNQKVYA
jgi:predicted RNase H-like HicB family nuclease